MKIETRTTLGPGHQTGCLQTRARPHGKKRGRRSVAVIGGSGGGRSSNGRSSKSSSSGGSNSGSGRGSGGGGSGSRSRDISSRGSRQQK